MNPAEPQGTDERCIDLVELLTAYLDDALPAAERQRFDEHLEHCAGCRAALGQWRTVIDLVGQLSVEDVASLDPYIRKRLMGILHTPRRL